MLLAESILQAMLWRAGAMEHVFFHSLIELGVNISIRDLS
jgi:hypothetical protein